VICGGSARSWGAEPTQNFSADLQPKLAVADA
jgi:hypothetical protein